MSTNQLSEATYEGPGEGKLMKNSRKEDMSFTYTMLPIVVLAPHVWGDIIPIHMDGSRRWFLGRHAYLASTMDISWTAKVQNFSKSLCASRKLESGSLTYFHTRTFQSLELA